MQVSYGCTRQRPYRKQSSETRLYVLLVRDDREAPGSIKLGDSLSQGHLEVHGRVGVQLKAHQVRDDLRVSLGPEKTNTEKAKSTNGGGGKSESGKTEISKNKRERKSQQAK